MSFGVFHEWSQYLPGERVIAGSYAHRISCSLITAHLALYFRAGGFDLGGGTGLNFLKFLMTIPRAWRDADGANEED